MRIIFFIIYLFPLSTFTQEYTLVWEDNFDASTLNLNYWNYDIGNGCPDLCGWGNNELEYYKEDNVKVENGILTITAKEETIQGYNYTSGKIHTRDKSTFTYGKFEARIKLPKGQGIWPAFWMLFNTPTYGGWPESGEIDIMELLGHDPDVVHGTIHYGGSPKGGSFNLPFEDFSEDFHTFSIEWDSTRVLWFVDSIQYASVSKWDIDQGFNWPFNHSFYIILNVAVGGNWPGNPNNTTLFPQKMEIDWVRVYQKNINTSIHSMKDKQTCIYPNPIKNGVLYFKNQKVSTFKIFNSLGKMLINKHCKTPNCSIDVSSLSNGTYCMYEIKSDKSIITHPLIICQ